MWLALNVSFGFYDGQARNKNTSFLKEIFFYFGQGPRNDWKRK